MPERPLDAEVAWSPAALPARVPLVGDHVIVRPVDAAADADSLYAVSHPPDGDLAIWTYLPDGPYESPGHVMEIGHIWFGVPLQRTTAATEAIYLLVRNAFDALGYRRLEWKCNALNAASRRAAERFGFTFEGVFRKHQVVKGRNRDTAWYSITDDEWPPIREAFQAWLAPANFDPDGRQRQSLQELRLRGAN